jgi:hypothetical protein
MESQSQLPQYSYSGASSRQSEIKESNPLIKVGIVDDQPVGIKIFDLLMDGIQGTSRVLVAHS